MKTAEEKSGLFFGADMTQREQTILCNCISVMAIVLAAGFIAGIKFPEDTLFEEQTKSEEWFREEASLVYMLATDCISDRNAEDIARLEKRIARYNREAERIRKWAYRCPPRFTLSYLGIKETEHDDSERNCAGDRAPVRRSRGDYR